MKKEYQKPEVEFVSLITERMMSDGLEEYSEDGTGGMTGTTSSIF